MLLWLYLCIFMAITSPLTLLDKKWRIIARLNLSISTKKCANQALFSATESSSQLHKSMMYRLYYFGLKTRWHFSINFSTPQLKKERLNPLSTFAKLNIFTKNCTSKYPLLKLNRDLWKRKSCKWTRNKFWNMIKKRFLWR